MKLEHLIESQQLNKDILSEIFNKADEIRSNKDKYKDSLNNKILATLFYEPSTRTRFSFESAMSRLGGKCIGTENASQFSSAIKGESLVDTVRVVGSYCDAIVLRHKETGSAEYAASLSTVPLINAGDGSGQHPTQALTDVYTINTEVGRLDNINVAMVGDLTNGRTVRSLSYLLGKFEGVKIHYVSPPSLKMGNDIKGYLHRKKVSFLEENNLDRILPEMDVIYMTRTQKERMSEEEYKETNGKYVLNESNLDLVKESARIMHPLPHKEEINFSVEQENSDKRIAYLRQVSNGLYSRMALLHHLLAEN